MEFDYTYTFDKIFYYGFLNNNSYTNLTFWGYLRKQMISGKLTTVLVKDKGGRVGEYLLKPYSMSKKDPRDEFLDISTNSTEMEDDFTSTTQLKKNMSEYEPHPKKNELPAIWDLVMEDIKQRDQTGEKKYGTRLQPFNGRDSLVDAYQEALDLVVYLRQAIYEKKINECSKHTFEPPSYKIPEGIYECDGQSIPKVACIVCGKPATRFIRGFVEDPDSYLNKYKTYKAGLESAYCDEHYTGSLFPGESQK